MPKKGLGNFHAAIFFSTALALPCPKSWIPHDYLSEGLTFFPALGSKRSETKHSPKLQGNRHTHID